jgi:Exonuclease
LAGHRIVEIGAVELIHRSLTGRMFHCYLNPERDMPGDAVAVHGLTAEFLADKPLFGAVADEFRAASSRAPKLFPAGPPLPSTGKFRVHPPNQTLPVSLYQCIGCHRRAGSKQQASPEITAAATHWAARSGPFHFHSHQRAPARQQSALPIVDRRALKRCEFCDMKGHRSSDGSFTGQTVRQAATQYRAATCPGRPV